MTGKEKGPNSLFMSTLDVWTLTKVHDWDNNIRAAYVIHVDSF